MQTFELWWCLGTQWAGMQKWGLVPWSSLEVKDGPHLAWGIEGPFFFLVPFVSACAKRACSCIILKFSACCSPLGQHSLQRVAGLACALFVVVFGFMFQSLVQPTLARILCCFYLLNRLIASRSRQKRPGGPL